MEQSHDYSFSYALFGLFGCVGIFLCLLAALIEINKHATTISKSISYLKKKTNVSYSYLYLLVSIYFNSQVLIYMHPHEINILPEYVHLLTVVLSLAVHLMIRFVHYLSKRISLRSNMLFWHIPIIFLSFYIQVIIVLNEIPSKFLFYESLVALLTSIGHFNGFYYKNQSINLIQENLPLGENQSVSSDKAELSLDHQNFSSSSNERFEKDRWKRMLHEKIHLKEKNYSKGEKIKDLLEKKRFLLVQRIKLIYELKRYNTPKRSFDVELMLIKESMFTINEKLEMLKREMAENWREIGELRAFLNSNE